MLVVRPILTIEQLNQLFRFHGRSDLDPDGVLDTPKVLDVGAVELSCSISDPDKVRGEVVELLSRASAVRPRVRRALPVSGEHRVRSGERSG